MAQWRLKGEAKAEAKQEELADAAAEIAKREQEAHLAGLGVLLGLLSSADPKIKLGAAKEIREAFYAGRGREGGDVEELLANVIAGALGDEKVSLRDKRTDYLVAPAPSKAELKN